MGILYWKERRHSDCENCYNNIVILYEWHREKGFYKTYTPPSPSSISSSVPVPALPSSGDDVHSDASSQEWREHLERVYEFNKDLVEKTKGMRQRWKSWVDSFEGYWTKISDDGWVEELFKERIWLLMCPPPPPSSNTWNVEQQEQQQHDCSLDLKVAKE